MEKIIPLREQLLVEPIEETKTRGGLHLPPAAMQLMKRGTVVASGTGVYYHFGIEPMQTKVGDKVLYPDGAGFEVSTDDKTYRIIPETSIVAIIREEQNG